MEVENDSLCSEEIEVDSPVEEDAEQSSTESVERVNPFEKAYLNNLQFPVWSPSTFENVDVNAETPPQSEWNIHELATLFPQAIEDSPSSHCNPYLVTPSTEAKAQADIDTFFNKGAVCPSPPRRSSIGEQIAGMLHRTPRRNPSILRTSRSVDVETTQRWTMTNVSIPAKLDPAQEQFFEQFLTTKETSGTEPSPTSFRSRISSINSSGHPVCRRLDLSFGECLVEEGFEAVSCPSTNAAFEDPFANNHNMVSPGIQSSSSTAPMHESWSTPLHPSAISELEAQFKRFDVTPDGRNIKFESPQITPIMEDDVFSANGTPAITPLGSYNRQESSSSNSSSSCARKTSTRVRQRMVSTADENTSPSLNIPSRRSQDRRRSHSEIASTDSFTPPVKIHRSTNE